MSMSKSYYVAVSSGDHNGLVYLGYDEIVEIAVGSSKRSEGLVIFFHLQDLEDRLEDLIWKFRFLIAFRFSRG